MTVALSSSGVCRALAQGRRIRSQDCDRGFVCEALQLHMSFAIRDKTAAWAGSGNEAQQKAKSGLWSGSSELPSPNSQEKCRCLDAAPKAVAEAGLGTRTKQGSQV